MDMLFILFFQETYLNFKTSYQCIKIIYFQILFIYFTIQAFKFQPSLVDPFQSKYVPEKTLTSSCYILFLYESKNGFLFALKRVFHDLNTAANFLTIKNNGKKWRL